MTHSIRDIIVRTQGGDKTDSISLVMKHLPIIRSVIKKWAWFVDPNDQDDLFQECVMIVVDSIETNCAGVDPERGFLSKIQNLVRSAIRTRKTRHVTFSDFWEFGTEDDRCFEIIEIIDQACQTETDRAIMRRFLAGHTASEISEQLGLNVKTVRRSIQSVRASVRIQLEESQ